MPIVTLPEEGLKQKVRLQWHDQIIANDVGTGDLKYVTGSRLRCGVGWAGQLQGMEDRTKHVRAHRKSENEIFVPKVRWTSRRLRRT